MGLTQPGGFGQIGKLALDLLAEIDRQPGHWHSTAKRTAPVAAAPSIGLIDGTSIAVDSSDSFVGGLGHANNHSMKTEERYKRPGTEEGKGAKKDRDGHAANGEPEAVGKR